LLIIMQSRLLASIDAGVKTLTLDWTGAFVEDVSPMEYFYAVGTVELRGTWDLLDW
jgi:hypothetical protein